LISFFNIHADTKFVLGLLDSKDTVDHVLALNIVGVQFVGLRKGQEVVLNQKES
jgi:hypothetical protein